MIRRTGGEAEHEGATARPQSAMPGPGPSVLDRDRVARGGPGPLLVTGATGCLGGHVLRAAMASARPVGAIVRRAPDGLPPGAVQGIADLRDGDAVAAVVSRFRPSVIVHCAARTDVDECERRWRDAWADNVDATVNLVGAAESVAAQVVYISSDAVFDGRSGPYRETDPANPLSVYARTKFAGELATLSASSRHLVLRTTFIGFSAEKRSFATWLLGGLRTGAPVPGFTDVRCSPLYVEDLAALVLRAIDAGLVGRFHLAARDGVSKYDLARFLAEDFGYDPGLVRATSVREAPLLAPRPLDTTLDVGEFSARIDTVLPSVRESVRTFAQASPGAAAMGERSAR